MFRRSRRDGADPAPSTGSALGDLALAVVPEAGFDGRASFDPRGPALELDGVGRLDLAAVEAKLRDLPPEKHRAQLRGTVKRFLRANRSVPPGLETADHELTNRYKRHQERHAKNPDAPGPLELLGRAERSAGAPGWSERVRSAAAAYEARYRRDDDISAMLSAASMHRLLGDADRCRALAAEVLPRIDPAQWGSDELNPIVHRRCAALALAAERAELAAMLAAHGPDQLGARWLPIVRAAGAAERGDLDALRHEIEGWQRAVEAEPVDTRGLNPNDHDLMSIMQQWLTDAS